MKQIKTILLAQLAVIAVLLCISAPAWANLAANTQILNQATLSYYDGSTTKTATSSVTVTVSLVCAAPTLTAGAPQTTSYNGPATPLTDSFIITAASNGPDTYNLSATVSGSTNTTGPTATPVTATVALGASVTAVGSTVTTINVPADGNLPGEMPGVNGIQIGDTVVINGEEKNVTNISDNASGISTITLNSALSVAPAAGVVVGERKTVNTTVTAGTITASGTDVTVSDTMTATSCAGGGAAITSNAVLNTYTSGVATLTKYVRNVSVASGTGTPYGYGGNNYYLDGVKAKPGETLEYVLVSTNGSLTGAVTAAVVTDAIPTAYVTLKTGVYAGSTDITYVDEAAVVHHLTRAADTDNGVYSAPNLAVNVGGATPPAAGTPPYAGGTIPLNSTVLVLYQVTVN